MLAPDQATPAKAITPFCLTVRPQIEANVLLKCFVEKCTMGDVVSMGVLTRHTCLCHMHFQDRQIGVYDAVGNFLDAQML